MRFPLSVAHLAALSAVQIALLLCWLAPRWAWTPLALFLVVAAIAPMVPAFQFYLPVFSRGRRDRNEVALTFDDGPDPQVTPRVLDLLDRYGLKAAFFVVGTKAEAHPDLIREILARGHDIGNHSWSHDTLVTLKGGRRLAEEVDRLQDFLGTFGIRPWAFRPPVGITNRPLWGILLDRGMFCMNFSCRAGDLGNRRIGRLAEKILARIRPGDVVLLHDVMPASGQVEALLASFEAVIEGCRSRGLEIVPPARLMRREIMGRDAGPASPVQAFYQGLAEDYDHEQFETGVARSRNLERKLFLERLPSLLPGGGTVLEVGAGTGIFTLDLARRCDQVHAIDLSLRMLDQLRAKAEAAGVGNIRTEVGDAETMALGGPYRAVVAFLSLEYFQDLPGFLRRVGAHMEPGGRIYFITARTSLLRFFIQIGNALRQGLWLRARTGRELRSALAGAGVQEVRMTPHLLRGWFGGGMLWEVTGVWPGGAGRG